MRTSTTDNHIRRSNGREKPRRRLPRLVKLLASAFTAVLVPVYWVSYGPSNFLWFSDIALLATVVALWTESRLLVSTQAVSVLALELLWNVDFFVGVTTGVFVTGLSAYMVDSQIPLFVRSLSLFHIWLPVVLVWMLWRLGYDRRAVVVQTLVAWAVLPVCYLATDPSKNINWVFGVGEQVPQPWMPPGAYFGLLMVGFPCVYFVTHFALSRLFSEPPPPRLESEPQLDQARMIH